MEKKNKGRKSAEKPDFKKNCIILIANYEVGTLCR